jgi:hypothetical protein
LASKLESDQSAAIPLDDCLKQKTQKKETGCHEDGLPG